MSYWDYDEPVWEPSEADELFDEMKSKLVEAAKASLKNDMESLKRRNEYLEKRNKELEEKAQEVSRKESDLKYKEQNLRREVEKEFYKTAIEDMFKDALEKSQLWFAYNKPHEKPKCDKWFPSSKMCRFCGTINSSLTLADRIWTCDCGKTLNRDENAAINILNVGLSTV